jgi:hypothetical protein
MATTTPNYGWTVPTSTDLVKDGATAIETLGDSVDATVKALNPETTLADISYRSSTANTNTRLAIGSSGQVLTVAGGVPAWVTPAGGGKVLQVVSATTSTPVSNSTVTPADTGLTATITPTSASSKILVMISQPINATRSSDQAGGGWSLLRGSSVVYDMTGSIGIGTLYMRSIGSNTSTEYYGVLSMVYLDSPATTSATTYKTQQRVYQAVSSANTTSQSDGATSSIVLMEIGA